MAFPKTQDCITRLATAKDGRNRYDERLFSSGSRKETMTTPNDAAENSDAKLCSPAVLSLICIRAGELSTMTVKQLRLEHPDNIDGTYSGSQWQGVSKERLIQEILFEEFSDGDLV